MGKFLQFLLLILAATIVFSGMSIAQNKTDVIKKANELLKNYKPPAPTIAAPTETPAQAWQKFYQQQDLRGKTSKTQLMNTPIEPRNEQYRSNGRNLSVQQLLKNRAALPKSAAEIRAQMENLARQETANGKGPAWELNKRGIPVPAIAERKQLPQYKTPAEIAADADNKIKAQLADDQAHHRNAFDPNRKVLADYFGTLTGKVFIDSNHNGQMDPNEIWASGARIRLHTYYSNLDYYATTNSDGVWSFDDSVQADYYYVYCVGKQFYQETAPYSGASFGWYYINGNNQDVSTFGIAPFTPPLLTGSIYNDANHNGVRDTGETGLAGWNVYIYRYLNSTSANVTTDNDGNWSFIDSVGIGEYYVQETQQAGWLFTSNPSTYYPNPGWNGDTVRNLDFGNWLIPWCKVSGYAFNDLNHNGYWDQGEPPLSGWTINAYENAASRSFTTTTNQDGYYEFSDSGFAGYWNITEENQAGWLQTVPSSNYYFYVAGDTSTNMNFGNWLVPISGIRGTVWNDQNNNSQRDPGDSGLPGWHIWVYDEYHQDTLKTVTDADGNFAFDSLTWVGYYQIWELPSLDWLQTYPSSSWRPYIAGDTVTVDFGNYLPAAGELRVNTLPSNAVSITYGNAIINSPLAVWGNVHGGLVPLQYTLDYGDGQIDAGIVTDRHFLGTMHTYETAGPKTVVLKITDANGTVDSSVSIVQVYAASSKQIRINMAIEKGLLYNYMNQYPDGHWYDGYGGIGATGSSVLAFEENGHGPENDIRKDIYTEYVRLGLNYLLGMVHTYSISEQSKGNPDSDGDGLGAYFNDGENYANGIASLAMIASHKSATAAKNDTMRVGAMAGRTLYDLVVNLVDQIAFSQTDPGYGEGGWRYSVSTSSYGSSDNSATQWPGLVLEAAQNSWGIAVPQFVKDELLVWLQTSQDASGGFAYTDRGSWNNLAKTGAGIGGYASLGYTTDSAAVINAIAFLDAHWNDTYDGNFDAEGFSGNLYAMYAVAKGLRIINHRVPVVNVGSHNWYDEYSSHLLDNPTWGQQADGHWDASIWISGYPPLSTSFAILILTQGVIVPPPVAIIAPIGTQPLNTSFKVDGSGSFHQDPSKSIVEWLWDFDVSNGVDWNHPDASGPMPVNPGYDKETTYTITLRVKDNSEPPLYSIQTANVVVKAGHHPPVAVPIPPSRGKSYAAKVGEPIFLDGSASFSPDYPKDSVIAYSWDLDGNGTFGDATTDTVTVVFPTEHQGQVGLRVYDTQGDSSSNSAYITIVASRRDLFVRSFTATPSPVFVGGRVQLTAIVNNDQNSNTTASQVVVRFFDGDPLTVGNQIGEDFLVDLPIGAQDTVSTLITLSPRQQAGIHHFFVFLDANNQFAEWDENNNLASADVEVRVPPPHIDLTTQCLNFGTLALGDSLGVALRIGNTGVGVLTIDSLITSSADFWVATPESAMVSGGNAETLMVFFKPSGPGMPKAVLTVYSNDGIYTIQLNGQGELTATGTGQEIFSGLASVEGIIAPVGAVVEAYRTNGALITSYVVKVSPDQVEDNINYALSILEGQAGVADGDTIVFAIRTLSCEVLWQRHCEPLSIAIFHPQFPPPQGFTRVDINGVHGWAVSIPLSPGYNAVSWNVFPADQSVTGIFGDLLGKQKVKIILDYINNGRGNARYDYYIPALGQYNPFLTTNFRKGYFVRIQNDMTDTLRVYGQPFCTGLPIWMNSGYNFISYLPQYPDSTWHALASLKEGNLQYALDYMNGSFAMYPQGDFTVMAPGKGYFTRMEQPDTLVYPATSALVPSKIKGSRVVLSNATRLSMSDGTTLPLAIFAYGMHVQIDGKLVPVGSDIKAISADGIICGQGTFVAPGVFSMAIYGDNPATEKIEGAKAGDMVKIFINNRMIGQQVKWTEFGDTPAIDGSQEVTGLMYEATLPQVFALHQNFPNPFNPSTSIRYELPKAAHVLITIYDMLGREVRTLEQTDREAGYYQTVWDGRNDNGQSVASGIYTYRMTAVPTGGGATFVDTHKMIIVK